MSKITRVAVLGKNEDGEYGLFRPIATTDMIGEGALVKCWLLDNVNGAFYDGEGTSVVWSSWAETAALFYEYNNSGEFDFEGEYDIYELCETYLTADDLDEAA